ncbi:protein LBH isoform X7 [Pelodiscus sinensis]|uniref:protein LBH isoform X7 n=1 Tax=Pelodiscus sinensis TaxID=13735 RepID=UPI003F6C7A87
MAYHIRNDCPRVWKFGLDSSQNFLTSSRFGNRATKIGRRLLHRNGRCPSSPCDWGLVSGWLFKLSQVASHQDSQISDLTKFRFFFSFKYLSYYLWKIMEYRSDSRRLEKCTYTVHL